MSDVGDPLSPHMARDRRMARLLMLAERHRRFTSDQRKLGTADMRLLWLFNDQHPRTLREISDSLGLEQSTVNRQVAVAQTEGLLRRFRDPGAPAHLVEATDHGCAEFESALAAHMSTIDRGLHALGDADADRLLALLDRFVEAYGVATHGAPDTDASDANSASQGQ